MNKIIIKKKKLKFVRQDAHKKPRLGKRWRKPKGIDSKQRLKLRGYPRKIAVGYGSPRKTRHLSKEGLIKVIVSSVKDLNGVDKEKEGVVIASCVGRKKRYDIVKEAEKLSIKILNMKDPKSYLNKIDEMLEKKKIEKEEKLKEKEKKTKEKEKAAEEKKKKEEKEEKVPEDELAEKIEKEEEEKKKEKDKVLVTKE